MELYESINVQTSPDLKKLLLANQMNTVTCEQCALTFRVDKPLLYHDPARRFMIYQIPIKDDAVEEGEREFTESLGRLFSFELELVSESAVKEADILGKNVTVRLTKPKSDAGGSG